MLRAGQITLPSALVITTVVRLLIAAWILVTLVRAGRAAWHQRALVVAIWRAWRPRHLAGVVGLFVVVAGVATVLLNYVPLMDVGLGNLIGTETNAVFAPLEQAMAAAPIPTSGPDWPLLLLSSAFLLPLAVVLPWLAFVEEEVFRGGLETEGLAGQAWRALIFGLAHLVMLVPIGAALAVGVAGFVYGRIYLRAHADPPPVPDPARRSYRPSKRGRRAIEAQTPVPVRVPAPVPGSDAGIRAFAGSAATDLMLGPVDATRRQLAGVFEAAVWHSAFNTALVLAVWATFVAASFMA